MRIRNAAPVDYAQVISNIDAWWGGRPMADMLPKLFFVHFQDTSFVAEHEGRITAFLCGFFSQTYPEVAYIHFVGVDPEHRKDGLGRLLYERLFDVARARGRSVVRCVTSPVNKTSIAFHLRMGFEIEPGDARLDNLSVHSDYDGAGGARVCFRKFLAEAHTS